jgi:hypothetical protein
LAVTFTVEYNTNENELHTIEAKCRE